MASSHGASGPTPKTQIGIYQTLGESGASQEEILILPTQKITEMASGYAIVEESQTTIYAVKEEPQSQNSLFGFGGGSSLSNSRQQSYQGAFTFGVQVNAPISEAVLWELEAALSTGGQNQFSSERYSLGANVLWVPFDSTWQPYLGGGTLGWFEQTSFNSQFSGSGWNFGSQAFVGMRWWMLSSVAMGARLKAVLPWVQSSNLKSSRALEYQWLLTFSIAL